MLRSSVAILLGSSMVRNTHTYDSVIWNVRTVCEICQRTARAVTILCILWADDLRSYESFTEEPDAVRNLLLLSNAS